MPTEVKEIVVDADGTDGGRTAAGGSGVRRQTGSRIASLGPGSSWNLSLLAATLISVACQRDVWISSTMPKAIAGARPMSRLISKSLPYFLQRSTMRSA